MVLIGQQIIGSAYSVSGEQSFNAVDPSTGVILEPQFSEATLADVDNAANVAAGALRCYSQKSLAQRATFLESIGEALTALGPDLISRAYLETALPRPRLEGELTRTVNQLRLFANHVRTGAYLEVRIDCAQPERKPQTKPDLRAMQVPLGPVAVFGASNFPLAFSVAGGDTASALASGCPVVVKGHPAHPGTSELAGQAVMRAVEKNNFPAGVFSLLQAKNTNVGATLVQQPQIKAVAFTGSLSGGRALFDLVCSRAEPIPVYAEMGSVNPVFFLPHILVEKGASLAAALIESLTLGVGQFCTSPGLIIVINSDATDRFLHELETILANKSPGVMLHEGIKKNFQTGLNRLLSVDGVESCGNSPTLLEDCLAAPVLFRTSAKTLLNNPSVADEVFGPSAIVAVCDSTEEMLAVAAGIQGQLTASVHGTRAELTEYRELFSLLERNAGRLIVNNFPTGVEVCASMHHGGPYPATTDSRSTSVGTDAIKRFLRPVCYQNFPQELLPEPLLDRNKLNLWRLVDDCPSREDL